jgi:hypothetical protein
MELKEICFLSIMPSTEEGRLLGCDAVLLLQEPKFRKSAKIISELGTTLTLNTN